MGRGRTAGFLRRTSFLLAAALLAGGCDDTPTDAGDDPLRGDGAVLSIYLTDAPGEVAGVWVEVADVILVGGNGPLSLLEEPTELIDLLDLRDRSIALVEEREVDPEAYEQLRFVIGGAVLETATGDVFARGGAEHPDGLTATGTLQCPSCAQTGIKVRIPSPFALEEGENGLLLDFDVAQSFGRQAGQSGMWVMRPSIQGVLVAPDAIEDGRFGAEIRGTVALAGDGEDPPVELPVCGGRERTLEDFLPTATTANLVDEDGESIVFQGETSEAGEFRIRVLEPDSYALGYRGEIVLGEEALAWTAEVDPSVAEVTAEGEDVDGVAYTVTGATCEAAGN